MRLGNQGRGASGGVMGPENSAAPGGPRLRILLGAAFLMATSAIGPGFLTQTVVFTGQLGASFGFAILVSVLFDLGWHKRDEPLALVRLAAGVAEKVAERPGSFNDAAPNGVGQVVELARHSRLQQESRGRAQVSRRPLAQESGRFRRERVVAVRLRQKPRTTEKIAQDARSAFRRAAALGERGDGSSAFVDGGE